MDEKAKSVGIVAAGAATGAVIAGLPGIIIGLAVAAGATLAGKSLGDK